jgi:UDP-N-acetylglucosamine diphosphorylase/glucosamine-1-phosphate N-acetyltransferase
MSSPVIIILAAGEGKRMRSDTPKVLHLCAGKPMLVRVIETAQFLTPKKIVVVAGRHQESIIETLEKWLLDIKDITFVKQNLPIGTGNAVGCCQNHFEPDDHVLILNGDMPLIQPTLLRNLLRKAAKADGVVLTSFLKDPQGYGRILYEESVFKGIIEEKDCSLEQKQIKQVNTGVYVLKGKVLHDCLPNIKNDNQQQEYYLTDIVKLAGNYTMDTLLTEEHENIQIRGVNTPEELEYLSQYC